jgi:hypothetical protein
MKRTIIMILVALLCFACGVVIADQGQGKQPSFDLPDQAHIARGFDQRKL